MEAKRWLNTNGAFEPGVELFRSERAFSLWAHTVSHGQLLLRSPMGRDRHGGDHRTRLDVLFKPVRVVKVRDRFDGLVVRCASVSEEEEIRGASGSVEFSADDRFLVLESTGGRDYVVSLAFGWCEDEEDSRDPSRLSAVVEPGSPPWDRRPLGGVDGGLALNAASLGQLGAALEEPGCGEARGRESYRHVYVLMFRLPGVGDLGAKASPAGVFLTREEAECECGRRDAERGDAQWWVETVPIAV